MHKSNISNNVLSIRAIIMFCFQSANAYLICKLCFFRKALSMTLIMIYGSRRYQNSKELCLNYNNVSFLDPCISHRCKRGEVCVLQDRKPSCECQTCQDTDQDENKLPVYAKYRRKRNFKLKKETGFYCLAEVC